MDSDTDKDQATKKDLEEKSRDTGEKRQGPRYRERITPTSGDQYSRTKISIEFEFTNSVNNSILAKLKLFSSVERRDDDIDHTKQKVRSTILFFHISAWA